MNMEENLVLTNYGVTLRRLTHGKIELLRQWRNDPKIQQYMFYREYITPEMQERWYANLDKQRNYYFIIEYEGKEIGLINVKNIDFEKKNGESGVFIYDDSYLNTDVAYRAHLVMFDYMYEILRLEYTYSHMLDDNSRAIRFMNFLGGVVIENNGHSLYCELYADSYLTNKNRTHFLKRWNHFNKQ